MNTADRSIALVDLALASAVLLHTEFHPDEKPVKYVLRKWLKHKKLDNMEWIADVVDEANRLLEGRQARCYRAELLHEGTILTKKMVKPYLGAQRLALH